MLFFQRRQWHPTPVLLPGKSHGWRSLVGCSPWGREEQDTTERFHFHFSLSCIGEGHGNPLQCSCLENPRDGGAWRAAIYGIAQSQTRLKRLSSSSSKTHIRYILLFSSVQLLSQWTPGVGDGQGGLACCDSWGRKESDMTEQLIWSDLIRLSAIPCTAAHQASLSITSSRSVLKLMYIESAMPSNHLILCHPFLLPPSIFPRLQSFPASGSFPMIHFFASGDQIIGVSASASVLPMNNQDWFPLGWTDLISLQARNSQESSPTPQFKSINSSALSFLYSKTHIWIFVITRNWKLLRCTSISKWINSGTSIQQNITQY